jgi:DNA polymerase-3 subunit epsilon
MQLNLNKPIAFIDLETTGINLSIDRIVEIAILKIKVNGEREVKTLRINPEMPISEESVSVHGITNEAVKDCPTFRQVAPQLAAFMDGCDLAGYNSNKFDIPLLVEEFLRAEVEFDLKNRRMVDVQNIFHLMEQRTLAAAYKFYCNKEIENAHNAEADILATVEVFLAQLEKYKDVQIKDNKGNLYTPVVNNIEALHKLTMRTQNADLAGRIQFNAKGQEIFAFGKHKDKTVEEVFSKEPAYYNWIMDGDFPLYTKKVVTQIRLRMKTK